MSALHSGLREQSDVTYAYDAHASWLHCHWEVEGRRARPRHPLGPIQKLAFDVLGVCKRRISPVSGNGRIWSEIVLGTMPYQQQIVDLDLRIENIRTAIEGLRSGNASRTEIDRALTKLARVKSERLRLMLRQVNLKTELHQSTGTSEAVLGGEGGGHD